MRQLTKLFIISFMLFNFAAVHAYSSDQNKRIAELQEKLKSEPENISLLIDLGIIYHNSGAAGDKESVKKAEDIFKKIIELQPENAAAHCWYGSVLTLKGRDAKFPMTKALHVNKGTKEMDNAVELDPSNILIRRIRSENSLALPGFFNRVDVAIQDYEYMLKIGLNSQNVFTKNELAQFYLRLGTAYKRKGNIDIAKENWNKAITTAPDSKIAEQAKSAIDKIEE